MSREHGHQGGSAAPIYIRAGDTLLRRKAARTPGPRVLMWWRKKTLTFHELHESITAHFREVVSLVGALQAYPQPGLLDQLFGSGRAPYEWNRIHALNSPLASLIQKRREQLAGFLADLQSWDAIRLSTTRRKNEFYLCALVITRPPIHNRAYSLTPNLRPF